MLSGNLLQTRKTSTLPFQPRINCLSLLPIDIPPVRIEKQVKKGTWSPLSMDEFAVIRRLTSGPIIRSLKTM